MSFVMPDGRAAPLELDDVEEHRRCSKTLATLPELSVVIATRGRPALLRRCLAAVLMQDLQAERFEVIVVADGPDDATCAEVDRARQLAGGTPAMRYLQNCGAIGTAGARNIGWLASRAQIVAFTDDEAVPQAGWLAAGLRAMAGGAAAAGGRVEVPLREDPGGHAGRDPAAAASGFSMANVFVRCDALRRVGGLDERFSRAWRDDADLQFSLLEMGADIAVAADAVVLRPVHPAPWDICLRRQANVQFDALLYRKHPRLYLERVGRGTPAIHLAIVGLTVAAAVATWFGAWAMAWAFLGGAATGMALIAAHQRRCTPHGAPGLGETLMTAAAIPYLSIFWRLVGAWRFRRAGTSRLAASVRPATPS